MDPEYVNMGMWGISLLAAGGVGMGIGLLIASKDKKNEEEVPSQFAIYNVAKETDVVLKLREAYETIGREFSEPLCFTHKGELIKSAIPITDINKNITLEEFANGKILKIKLYEDAEKQKPIEEGQLIHDYLLKQGYGDQYVNRL